MAWTPKPSDIEWFKAHIGRIDEGGIWIVPMCGDFIQVHHSKKLLRRLAHSVGNNGYIWDRTKEIASRIGWETEDETTKSKE